MAPSSQRLTIQAPILAVSHNVIVDSCSGGPVLVLHLLISLKLDRQRLSDLYFWGKNTTASRTLLQTGVSYCSAHITGLLTAWFIGCRARWWLRVYVMFADGILFISFKICPKNELRTSFQDLWSEGISTCRWPWTVLVGEVRTTVIFAYVLSLLILEHMIDKGWTAAWTSLRV